jgi:hypothetical protein
MTAPVALATRLYASCRLALLDRPDVRLYVRDGPWGQIECRAEPPERPGWAVAAILSPVEYDERGQGRVDERGRELAAVLRGGAVGGTVGGTEWRRLDGDRWLLSAWDARSVLAWVREHDWTGGLDVRVDTTAYGQPGRRWCRVERVVHGDGGPFPVRACVPGRGTGQFKMREVTAGRVDDGDLMAWGEQLRNGQEVPAPVMRLLDETLASGGNQ